MKRSLVALAVIALLLPALALAQAPRLGNGPALNTSRDPNMRSTRPMPPIAGQVSAVTPPLVRNGKGIAGTKAPRTGRQTDLSTVDRILMDAVYTAQTTDLGRSRPRGKCFVSSKDAKAPTAAVTAAPAK